MQYRQPGAQRGVQITIVSFTDPPKREVTATCGPEEADHFPHRKKYRPARGGPPRQNYVLLLIERSPRSQFGPCWIHATPVRRGVSMQMIEYAEPKNFVAWFESRGRLRKAGCNGPFEFRRGARSRHRRGPPRKAAATTAEPDRLRLTAFDIEDAAPKGRRYAKRSKRPE